MRKYIKLAFLCILFKSGFNLEAGLFDFFKARSTKVHPAEEVQDEKKAFGWKKIINTAGTLSSEGGSNSYRVVFPADIWTTTYNELLSEASLIKKTFPKLDLLRPSTIEDAKKFGVYGLYAFFRQIWGNFSNKRVGRRISKEDFSLGLSMAALVMSHSSKSAIGNFCVTLSRHLDASERFFVKKIIKNRFKAFKVLEHALLIYLIKELEISDDSIEEKLATEETKINCSICLSELLTKNNIANVLVYLVICQACGTVFHYDCLVPWLRQKLEKGQLALCPTCRSNPLEFGKTLYKYWYW